MKKIFITLLAASLVSSVAIAQTTTPEYPIVTVGLNGGLDYNINAYRFTPTSEGGKYFSEKPRYNVGVDLGLQINKRWRPRFEMKFVNEKYGIDWSAYSNLGKTYVNVNYFDLNLRMDFLLIPTRFFQFYVSPAFKYEFEIGSGIINNYVMPEGLLNHPTNLIAGAVSGIFKFNVSNNVGITLTPEVTYFIHDYAARNNKPYQRNSCNIGVEYKF